MRNWDDLKLLLAVKDHGTMASTATALGVNATTIARRLDRLTEEVGSTLFVRRGGVLVPTSTAQPLIHLAELMAQQISPTRPDGLVEDLGLRTLRIHAAWQVMADVIAPHISCFLEKHEDIAIDFVAKELSVAFGEVDLKLSFEEPRKGRLIRQRMGEVGRNVFIHKKWGDDVVGYIELAGVEPRLETEMDLLQAEFQRPRLITLNTMDAIDVMHKMPLAMCLPTRFASRYLDLKLYNPNWETRVLPVWASYHESRRLDPDVRIAIDFIRGCFSKSTPELQF